MLSSSLGVTMITRNSRIKCAAIIYKGKIYEGKNHSEIGFQMLRDNVCPRPFPSGDAQGFVTEDGDFIGRYQALRIAAQAGQIEWGKTIHHDELFPEDLNKPKA